MYVCIRYRVYMSVAQLVEQLPSKKQVTGRALTSKIISRVIVPYIKMTKGP